MWLIGRTIRIEFVEPEHEQEILKSGRGFIYAFWHNQLFYFCYSHRRRRIMTLASRSDDGELISRVIKLLGFETSRGSITGGGGASAFRKLMHHITRSSLPVSICPDGPRGPRWVATKGVVFLASRSGCPILPVVNGFERRKVFNTWDRFVLPYPFTRGVIVFAPPMHVPKGASESLIEEKRRELENGLNALSARAEAYFSG